MNNIFDVIKNITNEKNEDCLGTEIYNPYMINRYMSMHKNYINYAVLLNRFYQIPKEYQELFLFHILPKKSVFLKYIKKENRRNNAIEKIQKNLNISDKKAFEINEFLNKYNEIKNGLF